MKLQNFGGTDVRRSGTAEMGAVYAKLSFPGWAMEIPWVPRVYSLRVNSGLQESKTRGREMTSAARVLRRGGKGGCSAVAVGAVGMQPLRET